MENMNKDINGVEQSGYADRKAVNKLLIKYMKVLSTEIIEDAIDMYKRGKSYEQIEDYLQLQLEQRKLSLEEEDMER